MSLPATSRATPAAPKRVPASAAEIQFDVVSTRAGFDALEGDWNALFERSARSQQLFQSFNWLWHWANHYLGAAGEGSLFVVTGRRNGKLVLAWPLVREAVGPVASLVWMGEPVSQYGDLIVDETVGPAAVLEAAWGFVRARADADVLYLRKVRDDAAIAPLLPSLQGQVTGRYQAPFLDLASAPTFEEYEKRYSSNARKNRRRYWRRLADRGETVIEFTTAGTRARELTGIALDLKKTWLADRGLMSPAVASTEMARFFADVAGAAVRPAGCHVLALSAGGVPAALEIGVRAKGRSATHVIVYDLTFDKVSAGNLLMEESIRRAKAAGIETFDLMAPADPYKLEWADGTVAVQDVAVPLTALGQAYAQLYLGSMRRLGKWGLEQLPIRTRQRLARRLYSA